MNCYSLLLSLRVATKTKLPMHPAFTWARQKDMRASRHRYFSIGLEPAIAGLNGAGTRNRTAGLLITNQSLYQLSYPGNFQI